MQRGGWQGSDHRLIGRCACLTYAEQDDPRFQLSVFGFVEQPDGDGQLEAAGAAGARVEVEHAFLRDKIRDVGVAVEDGGEFGGRGVEVKRLEVVEHVDVEAGVGRVFDEDDVGFGEFCAGAADVDIAADGGDGCDFGEFGEDGDFADVAKVEDAVDAAEGGCDLRAEEAVGVGDDAEEHGVRISGASLGLGQPAS